MKVIHILPAFNCADTISTLLLQLPSETTIVVDDGSNDKTIECVRALGFKYISHGRNMGVGAALKTGISYALESGFSHAVTIDADGQHPVSRIPEFVHHMAHYDFVIGNRFRNINIVPDPKLSSNLFASLVIQRLFSIKLTDVACGFRGFRLNESLLHISDNGYGFLYRHLIQVLANQASIKDIEIDCIYPFNQPLCTRKIELASLIAAAFQFTEFTNDNSKSVIFDSLITRIEKKEDLQIEIEGYEFYAFYITNLDSYVFQSPKPKVSTYYVPPAYLSL